MAIPAIPLKGADIALNYYSDVGLRLMVDFDVLVPEEKIDEAERLLLKMGYESTKTQTGFAPGRRRHHHIPPLVKRNSGAIVEIHRAFCCLPYSSIRFDYKEIWGNARPGRLLGSPCLFLAPEDTLLLIALDATHGIAFDRALRHLCDLRPISSTTGFSWDILVQRSARYGMNRHLYYYLFLAKETVGAPVPGSILSGLRKSLDEKFLALILLMAFRKRLRKGMSGFLQYHLWRLILSPSGWSERIRLALRISRSELLHGIRYWEVF
jgi:hypothetical protein